MMREPQKVSVTSYRPKSPREAVSLEQWLNRDTVVPTFSRGAEFCDWLVDQKAVFSENLLPLHNLPELLHFLTQWAGGMCFKGYELQQNGWLKWGRYQLYLSSRGRKLTVRRGNEYGHFIDLGGLAATNWPDIVQAFQKAGVYKLPYPSSPGGVAAGLLDRMTTLSTNALPAEVLSLAWQACKGGRMEALTLGTFNGHASDLSSAYPAAARDLPRCDHPRLCEWRASTEYQPTATYGVALIDVDLPAWRAGPLAVRTMATGPDDDLELHFPAGRHERVAVAMPDMQLLQELGIPFRIRKAWWGFVMQKTYPFQRLMNLLWAMRQEDKDFAKAVAVAAVGQLGSVDNVAQPWAEADDWEARPYFAPVYFSHIYATVRANLFRQAMEAGLENVHAFSIDGLITSQPLFAPGADLQMGGWRNEGQGEFFLTGDYFKDRPDGDGRWRAAVATTVATMPQDQFLAEMDTYVSLPLAWQQRGLDEDIGSKVPMSNTIPLGTTHRQAPRGLRRADYLREAIPTWLA